jgi:hypothetical protein
METTRFLGSPVQNGTVLAANASERPAPETRVTERDEDRSAVASSTERKKPSKPQPDAKPNALQEPPVTTEVVPLAAAIPSRADRRFVAPSPTQVRVRSVDIAPPAVPTAVSNNAPFFPASLPHLPSPELPKQVYRGPTEGKIIWAGKLPRHGTIEIQGNRASQGHLTGGLPGVPVRVQVFPAELTPGGLRIFMADAKGVGNTEAPGAQNGWNRTSYVLNPAQSDRLRLIETPSAQNAWNRVMVRAERGDQTIIILKWELAGTEASLAR